MFLNKIIKLLQKLFFTHITLPVIISLIAIFTIFFSFVIFAQRILFIYDPYTIEISNCNVSQIKKSGLRHLLFIKTLEANYENFPEIYKNISDKEKEKSIVISTYLYSMFKDNEEYKAFFNNSKLHLYGPLFDYEQAADTINVFTSISNKTELKYFLEDFEKLIFYIPESIYEKKDFIEPENTLISLLTDIFYSAKASGKNNGNVLIQPLDEKMGKNAVSPENNSIAVLCLRKISPGARSLITESDGKFIFFDYINSRNLRNTLYVKKETVFSSSISYDYKKSLDKIFKIIGEKSEKRIDYIAVFSFFTTK
jgi:hypothetical protein